MHNSIILELGGKAETCFGGDLVRHCITVGNLQALGLDLQTASSYVILLTVSGTECQNKKGKFHMSYYIVNFIKIL